MTDPQANRSLWGRWQSVPLYLQILIACVLGAVIGVGLRELDVVVRGMDQESFAGSLKPLVWASWLAVPARMVLQLLTALAAPLVLIAVVQALMHAQIPAGNGRRLIFLLL